MICLEKIFYSFKYEKSFVSIFIGIFALALEANPKLTWRDLQHLIVHSARKVSPLDSGWQQNGAGLLVNEKFGFGSLDAKLLVDAARDPNWKTVDTLMTYTTPRQEIALDFIPNFFTTLHSRITFDRETTGVCINKLEHVHAIVSLRLARPSQYYSGPRSSRGKHSLTLTSPSGTVSELLLQRPRDSTQFQNDFAFKEWQFMTVFNWDEDPNGVWTLKIVDHAGSAWANKLHFSWKLKLSGTCKPKAPKWATTHWDLLKNKET